METNLPIVFRQANKEDINFIFNAWLKSFRNSMFASKLSNTVYFSEHHKIVEKLITNSNVIVACPEDDTTNIIGFICASTVEGVKCFHYVYVKQSFRNLGIAKMLLHAFNFDPATASIYTHHTRPMDTLQHKYNMLHQPYVALTDSYIQSDKFKDLVEQGINNGRSSKRKPGRPKRTNPLKDSISQESKDLKPEETPNDDK